MSFSFKWPRFSDQFHEEAKEMLHAALNKGSKPPIIADKIEVVELEMGTEPPELEIKDIGQLTKDQFRGIFKLTYAGDAFIVLRTKVQANPLNHRKKNEMSDLLGGSAGILAAHQPLVVPMLLRLSQFRLNSYVVLVLSKQKGCTLVFKTDPLQNVEVSSTFDSIAVIQSFIQREIEEQLREMFREDLPSIIHRLSQRWVAGQTRVEAPYLRAPVPAPPPRAPTSPLTSTRSLPGAPSSSYSRRNRKRADEPLSASMGMLPAAGVGLQSGLHPPSAFSRPGPSPLLQRTRSRVSAPAGPSTAPPSSYTPPSDRASARSGTKTPLSSDFPINPHSSLPDIENFDPTYGLRPEGLPQRSGYSGLGRLFEASRGLRDLAEDQSPRLLGDVTADMEGESAYDVVEWEDDLDREEEELFNSSSPHAAYDDVDDEPAHPEYVDMETIPAVGGGFITRPRVYQSQSSSSIDPTLAQTPSSRGQTYAYRERNAPRFSSSQAGDSKSPGRSRARRAGPSRRRDRGIGLERGRGEESYNPYFGDAIYSNRSPGQQINPGVEDEFGMTSSHSNHLRRSTASATSKTVPIGIGSFTTGLRDSSRDRQRSISRSPPHAESFPYGSSPSPHHRHFPGSTSDDPDIEFGNMNSDHPNGPYGRNNRGIVLRNQSVSQLSALSRSNQTLSPYTRSFSHFTVRSGPPKPFISNTTPFTFTSAKRGPAKARRKRIHRLGLDGSSSRDGGDKGSKLRGRGGGHYGGNSLGDGDERGSEDGNDRRGRERGHDGGDLSLGQHYDSPSPPSEFSDEDVEHYFRTRRPSEVLSSPMRSERILHGAGVVGSSGLSAGSAFGAESRQRTISHSSQRSR